MTLIASLYAKPHFIGIGDALLSGQSGGNQPALVGPMQREPYRTTAEPIIGLVQKVVQLSKTHVLLWAGIEVVAKALCEELQPFADAGQYVDVRVVVQRMGLTKYESANSHFILMSMIRDYAYTTATGNGRTYELEGGCRLYGGGTGLYDFIDDTKLGNIGTLPGLNPAYSAILMHTHEALVREIPAKGLNSFNYGGWFEVCEWEAGGFKKQPLTVQPWEIANGKIVPLGTSIFATYVGFDLHIVKAEHRGDDTVERRTTIVPDFLGRTQSTPSDTPENIATARVLNLIGDTDHEGGVGSTIFMCMQNARNPSLHLTGEAMNFDTAFCKAIGDTVAANRWRGRSVRLSEQLPSGH